MRNSMIWNKDFDSVRPINSAHEKAIFIFADASYPINDILIGKTFPYPEFHINLGATQKYYIFEYVTGGRGKILFGDKWQDIEAGDTYIIDKTTVRNYYSDREQPLEKMWISFSSDYMEQMLVSCGIKEGVWRANTRPAFEKIFAVAAEDAAVKEKIFKITNAVNEIVMAIAETNSFGTDSFSKIKNGVLTMLYEKASLDTIANRLFMSKSNLIRTFKKHTGTTPYNFLLDEKIRLAKVLLRSTNMSVRTVAEQLCFTDEHYFSYIFKRKTGVSPLKYRNGEERNNSPSD